jgi:hypothetical protein
MISPFDPKDPDEVDWINFDFRPRLTANGDTIATVHSVEIEAGDEFLILGLPAEDDGVVSVRWQGGTLETDYAIRCRVTTTAGRTWDLSGTVTIVSQ